VADRSDKCPNTPALIEVDKNGCPLDKDGDGVADYLDACPDVAGTVALNGCPDTDSDGVTDKNDRCPDVAGTTALQGCPDTDGDGIADMDDACPSVAGFKALNGCPDSDNDGIADADDRCPNTKAGYKVNTSGCPMDNDNDGIINEEDRCPNAAGVASLKGCPDTDADGVADLDDRCPLIKGTIANKGCPEMTKAEVKRITQIASKIFFETNSDKLKVASLVQLDELALILKKYENANLSIDGYTDSQGADDYNLTLSQKRTDAVKTYLMAKGIMESRLAGIGYGETLPIADNKTAIGRAKNRRVELKTSY
jgi:outer membrane protein OmpA-like peptidoglycan-associated protein